MSDLIKVQNNIAILEPEVLKAIANLEEKAKAIKETEDFLKQAILQEMEAKGILKVDSDQITITYVAPTDRESFDSKSFRSSYPDLYDAYVRITPVKASIRIKLKGER